MENALIPESPTAALRAAAILSLLLAIAGCSVFKTNEEAQAAINQRVVGMSVGDFFDRYGPAKLRCRNSTAPSSTPGSRPSAEKPPNSGFYGLDDRTCTLKLVASRDGKIATATILQDMPGRTSTSRCLEVFKTA